MHKFLRRAGLRAGLFCTSIQLLLAPAFAARTPEEQLPLFPGEQRAVARQEKLRGIYAKFLSDLGFNDIPAEIEITLQTRRDLSASQIEVLRQNQSRFQVLNHSRELAIKVALYLEKSYSDIESREKSVSKAIRLASRLLTLEPFAMPRTLPSSLSALPDGKEKAEALQKFYLDVLRTSADDHLIDLASDFAATLYEPERISEVRSRLDGQLTAKDSALLKELLEIQTHLIGILTSVYSDLEIGQTRYLGRAVSAVILKFGQLHDYASIKVKLQQDCKRRGVELNNFIGAEFRLTNDEGKIIHRPVRSGTFVNERSDGKEADDITSAVWPAWPNLIRAIKLGLVGTFASRFLAVDPSIPPSDLTFTQRVKLNISHWKIFTRGYSHGGIMEVKQDQSPGEWNGNSWLKTPISIAWILDIYDSSNGGPGGVRQIGMESFAPAGRFLRIGFADYDPVKVWRLAQKQIAEAHNGKWTTDAWPAFEPKEVKDSDPIADMSKPNHWQKTVTKDEFLELHNVPVERAHEWYEDVIVPEIIRGIHEMMTVEGAGFAYGFAPVCHRAYCEQLPFLMSKMHLGLDLISHPDHFAPHIRFMKWLASTRVGKKVMPPDLRDGLNALDLSLPIVAPAGALWDEKVRRYDRVDFPDMSQADRFSQENDERLFPMSLETAENLKIIRGFAAVRLGIQSDWTKALEREDLLDVTATVINWGQGIRSHRNAPRWLRRVCVGVSQILGNSI